MRKAEGAEGHWELLSETGFHQNNQHLEPGPSNYLSTRVVREGMNQVLQRVQ